MPKSSKRNIKLPAQSAPASKPVAAKPAVPAKAQAVPSTAKADRAIARDSRYLANAAYITNTSTPISLAYLPLFVKAAKAAQSGEFHTSQFERGDSLNPESPKRNFRARAKLLADHGILRHVTGDTFAFTAAVTAAKAPDKAASDILAARTAYHGKA